MFTPNPNRTFVRDVTIYWPKEDGGTASGQVRAHYESRSQEVVEEWADEGRGNSEVLSEVLVGVEKVGDGSGGELDQKAAVQPCIADPAACSALAEAFFKAVLGGNRKRKTSKAR